MKYVILTLAMTFAGQASAANLSSEMKSRMIDAIKAECNVAEDAQFEIKNVAVTEKQVDQGIIDKNYVVTFQVSQLANNEENLKVREVKVKGWEYYISNPAFDNIEITSVYSSDDWFCK